MMGLRLEASIFKSFDEVWYKGLRLSQNDISNKLPEFLSNFLSNRKQRVVANTQISPSENLNTSAP